MYALEWTETWREGSVEVGKPDGNPEATYRIKETILCEVVSVWEETCQSNTENPTAALVRPHTNFGKFIRESERFIGLVAIYIVEQTFPCE